MKRLILIGVLLLSSSGVQAQVVPDYDFDWATIGDPGNAPIPGPPPSGFSDHLVGRGSVDHLYRAAKMEVTSAQWLEFTNTFSTMSDDAPNFGHLKFWGAERDPTYTGPGTRWRIINGSPGAAQRPVFNVSWREAAQYANWLHNFKEPSLSAIADGAYDTSTFATLPDGTFTDQLTRSPGSRFFIPTIDEWVKAAHYDPDKDGPGQGGWWLYPTTSDTAPVPGAPGEGETSGGWEEGGFAAKFLPLGAYPDTQSPWGLLDASGGTIEWTEEDDARIDRFVEGSFAGSPIEALVLDNLYARALAGPRGFLLDSGLRVFSVVPGPPLPLTLGIGIVIVARRTRKRIESSTCEPTRPWSTAATTRRTTAGISEQPLPA